MAFAALSHVHPDGPFDFSHLPPAPIYSAEDVFRGGIILPHRAASPPKGTAAGSDLRGRRPQEASAESFRPPRRAWGRGASEKIEYQRLRGAADGQRASRLPLPLPLLGKVGSVPAAMDMDEIRNRQRPAGVAGGDVTRGLWKLLSLLSCRGIESAAVATPAPLILASHVRLA